MRPEIYLEWTRKLQDEDRDPQVRRRIVTIAHHGGAHDVVFGASEAGHSKGQVPNVTDVMA